MRRYKSKADTQPNSPFYIGIDQIMCTVNTQIRHILRDAKVWPILQTTHPRVIVFFQLSNVVSNTNQRVLTNTSNLQTPNEQDHNIVKLKRTRGSLYPTPHPPPPTPSLFLFCKKVYQKSSGNTTTFTNLDYHTHTHSQIIYTKHEQVT